MRLYRALFVKKESTQIHPDCHFVHHVQQVTFLRKLPLLILETPLALLVLLVVTSIPVAKPIVFNVLKVHFLEVQVPQLVIFVTKECMLGALVQLVV
jgi:hypothetical protein